MPDSDGGSDRGVSRHGITLPDGTKAERGLVYDPSRSLVTLSSGLIDTLGETIGVLQFPVCLAARLVRGTVPDSLRTLSRRTEQYLLDVEETGRELRSLADRLATVEAAQLLLLEEFGPALRTVVQYQLASVVCDDAFVDWYAADYAAKSAEIEPAEIRQICAGLSEECSGPYPVPALSGTLEGLSKRHGSQVAATVADLAIRPAVSVGTDGQIDLRELARFNIESRARELAKTVDEQFDDTTEIDASTLERCIAKESAVDLGPAESEQPSEPRFRAATSPAHKPMRPELAGQTSGLAWLLTRTFLDGGVGGVVYPWGDDGYRWLVNPWRDTDSRSYRQQWSRRVVLNDVLEQLLTRARGKARGDESETGPITCPLCQLSAGTCGRERCAFWKLLAPINGNRTEFVHELAVSIERLQRTDLGVFDDSG